MEITDPDIRVIEDKFLRLRRRSAFHLPFRLVKGVGSTDLPDFFLPLILRQINKALHLRGDGKSIHDAVKRACREGPYPLNEPRKRVPAHVLAHLILMVAVIILC